MKKDLAMDLLFAICDNFLTEVKATNDLELMEAADQVLAMFKAMYQHSPKVYTQAMEEEHQPEEFVCCPMSLENWPEILKNEECYTISFPLAIGQQLYKLLNIAENVELKRITLSSSLGTPTIPTIKEPAASTSTSTCSTIVSGVPRNASKLCQVF